MRIYFDEKMVNEFMTYAMERKAGEEKRFRMIQSFTFESEF